MPGWVLADRSILLIVFFAFLSMPGTPTAESQSAGKITAPSNKQLASPEIERKVDALLKKMTLDEKLGQLVQYSDSGYNGQAQTADETANPGKNPTAPHPVDAMELVVDGKVRIAAEYGWAGADERFAARGGGEEPTAYPTDVWCGHHSWIQDDLSDAAGASSDIRSGTGKFACAYFGKRGENGRRGLVLFADGGYIKRSAVGKDTGRRGRGSVSWSAMARAYIRGYQQGDLSSPTSVAACVKHYAAYGAAEAGTRVQHDGHVE